MIISAQKKIPLNELYNFKRKALDYPEFKEVTAHFSQLLEKSPTALDNYYNETSTLLLKNSRKIYERYQSSSQSSAISRLKKNKA